MAMTRFVRRVAAILLAASGFARGHIATAQCQEWSDQFFTPWLGGGSGMVVFDGGSGPELYVGGITDPAGSPGGPGIARWNGEQWTELPYPVMDTQALAVFDDGGGPALYAAGRGFQVGSTTDHVVKWNGASWESLGSAIAGGNAFFPTAVAALAVFDDGSGPALYAAGNFTIAGAGSANYVAKWDGTAWSALGTGLSGGTTYATSLCVYDDGTGPALYAGGNFSSAGGVTANYVAKWDGAAWSSLGAGAGSTTGTSAYVVETMAVYDHGTGPGLYVGGALNRAGGAPANYVARWDGISWSPLGSGTNGYVFSLAAYDAGEGAQLYASGVFSTAGGIPATNIARWDGSSWAALDGNVYGTPPRGSLAVYDDGCGPRLFVGGVNEIDGINAGGIAKWDGEDWACLGAGLGAVPAGTVRALHSHDDGSGRALFMGGGYSQGVTRWNGQRWLPVGSGLVSAPYVDFVAHDDGSGTAHYASVATSPAGSGYGVARWDGTSWSVLGMTSFSFVGVAALASIDFGSGPELYAGESFASIGGVPSRNLARWNGSTWSGVGGGTNNIVYALAV
jgi:hypothetical protein